MLLLSVKWRNLIRIRHLSLDMIWLNIGVEIRLLVDQYIANLGLWTTPIRITTANRVSISAPSVAFHWCTKECGLKLFWCCSINCCAYSLVYTTMWSIIWSVMYSLKKSYAVRFLGRGTSILSSPVNFTFLGLNGSPGYILFHCHRGTIGWLCLAPTYLGKPGGSWALICFVYSLLELALHLQGPVYLLLNLWDFSNIFCSLFILSMTCWSFSTIFCSLFVLSMSSWSFSTIFCSLLSCPKPAGASLLSSAACLSHPQPAQTSLPSSAACSSCPWLAEASPRPISSSYILLLVLLSFLTEGGLFTLTVEALLAVIRAECVILVRKIQLPDAGQHLDHSAQYHLYNSMNRHFI